VLDVGVGPAVVCLHGIPTSSYLWRGVAERLRLTRRVVAPDLLGFGQADMPSSADLTPSGQADFLEIVLDRLGVEQFALVVHDYGALVGTELLAREPERVEHLTVLNTSFELGDWRGGSRLNPFRLLRVPGLGEAAFAAARPFMLRLAFAPYLAERRLPSEETLAVYWEPFERGFAGTLLQLARSTTPDEDDFRRWRAALSDNERRSLIVWGLKDPTFTTERGQAVQRLLPQARFVGLRNANHFVPEDRPVALARLVEAELLPQASLVSAGRGMASPLPNPDVL
jgi:pimeloyl-ACP methyl ester carboxylesterase